MSNELTGAVKFLKLAQKLEAMEHTQEAELCDITAAWLTKEAELKNPKLIKTAAVLPWLAEHAPQMLQWGKNLIKGGVEAAEGAANLARGGVEATETGANRAND